MITIVIMETKGHTIRVDDEVWAWVNGLPGSINEALRELMSARGSSGDSLTLLEILEHTRTMAAELPDAEQMQTIVEDALQRKIEERAVRPAEAGYNPASVPGVQVGAHNLPPPRRLSFAEQREIDRKKHLETVASDDTIAQAAGRTDIDYDAEK